MYLGIGVSIPRLPKTHYCLRIGWCSPHVESLVGQGYSGAGEGIFRFLWHVRVEHSSPSFLTQCPRLSPVGKYNLYFCHSGVDGGELLITSCLLGGGTIITQLLYSRGCEQIPPQNNSELIQNVLQ